MEQIIAAQEGSAARRFQAAFVLSLRRLIRTKFLMRISILAALPVVMAILSYLGPSFASENETIERIDEIWPVLINLVYLKFIVFFGASIFGFAVMRQELEDQTLHYLLLQPINRWMLIVGRFLAFLLIGSAICVTSLWITYFVLTGPRLGFGYVFNALFSEGRLQDLLIESLVITLGLLVFGALALLMASIFKSVFYVLLLLAWESALPWLPGSLKFWTITHYLHALLPQGYELRSNFLALPGEPPSTAMSFLFLSGFSLVLIAAAIARFQSKECLYGDS